MPRSVSALLLGLVILSGCAGEAPEVPAGPDGTRDPVLVTGREIYSDRCSSCHGSGGGGGSGPKLSDGAVVEDHPELSDTVELVRNGKGRMPAFGGTLSDDEIVAVARYVREVL